MLRYIEETGLVLPGRSPSGYRLYGPGELQRLRTLRHLLEEFGIELSDVGFASRLQRDAELHDAVGAWLVAPAIRPAEIAAPDWLSYEQEKHLQLLVASSPAEGPRTDRTTRTTRTDSARTDSAHEKEMA
jgi:DNA-binding transcriptional MerR regulator